MSKRILLFATVAILIISMVSCTKKPVDSSKLDIKDKNESRLHDDETTMPDLLQPTGETGGPEETGGDENQGNSGIKPTSPSKSNAGGITKQTVTPSVQPPKITEDEQDKKATLPKLDIKDKEISVCVDWSPSSNWVKGWVAALNYCYPGMKISWKQAVPDQKASKLAVWEKAGQSPDVMYIKPEESWPLLINNNLLMPVDKYIDTGAAFWGSIKGTMDRLKLSGNNYVLPSSVYYTGDII